jgi:hypothetical protein
MSRKWFIALAACVGLLATTSLAQANPLPPNSLNVVPDTFGGATGTILGDRSGTWSYNVGGATVAGNWHEIIEQGRPGNTLGGLSFAYDITVQSATFALTSFTVSNYAGYTLDVGTFQPGGFTAPNFASRDVAGAGVNWTFASLFAAGSAQMILDTNAPNFQDGFLGFSGGGGGGDTTGGFPGYAPAGSPVPEPATLTLALLGLPLAAAFGYRRLRRGKPAVA